MLGLSCYRPAFSSGGERGLLSTCGAWASHCGGFSCGGARTLGLSREVFSLDSCPSSSLTLILSDLKSAQFKSLPRSSDPPHASKRVFTQCQVVFALFSWVTKLSHTDDHFTLSY